MKRRDLINLIAAIVVISLTIFLVVRFAFGSKRPAQPVMIEVVPTVDPTYDQAALSEIKNSENAVDFNVKINLRSGLNNRDLFGD